MMATLNRNNSNWSFEERRKINENWDILETMANSTANGNNGLKSEVDQLKITTGQNTTRSNAALQTANQAKAESSAVLSVANDAKREAENTLNISNEANVKSDNAVQVANDSKQTAETIQTRFNEIIAEAGSNNPEVVSSRTDSLTSTTYMSLPERLDAQHREVISEIEEIKNVLSGTVYVESYADLVVGNDWSPAIRFIVDNAENVEIVLPNQTIEMHSQIDFIKSKFKLRGQPNTKIINMLNSTSSNEDSLFNVTGTRTEYASKVAADVNGGANVIRVDNPTEFAVGDYVAFYGFFRTQNISVVIERNFSAGTITLDRPFSYPIPTGSTIFKINAIEDVEIADLDIDFNRKYGYGVLVTNARNVNVRRVKGVNIGSKVVQYNASFDCTAEDIIGKNGFDNFNGGQSYVIRFGVCNDCTALRIVGHNARHTVDLSGASRNTIRNCEGYYNTSADFLTHGNHCRDNIFIDCKSVSNPIAAYSINPNLDPGNLDAPGGDINNIIQGGTVINSTIIYHPQDGSNIIKGITFKGSMPYSLRQGGKLTLEGCTFILDAALINSTTTGWDLTFLNCRFTVNAANGLGNMTNATTQVNITFDNCDITSKVVGGILLMPTNSNLILKNINFKSVDIPSNNPPFVTKGKMKSLGSIMGFETSGVSFFGLQAGANFLLNNCHIINSTDTMRPYTLATAALTLGNNNLENSNYANLNVLQTIRTIGTVDIGATVIPTFDKFVVGSRVLNNAPDTGLANSWVYTSSGWKSTGNIL